MSSEVQTPDEIPARYQGGWMNGLAQDYLNGVTGLSLQLEMKDFDGARKTMEKFETLTQYLVRITGNDAFNEPRPLPRQAEIDQLASSVQRYSKADLHLTETHNKIGALLLEITGIIRG